MILHPNSNKPNIKLLEMFGLCERCKGEGRVEYDENDESSYMTIDGMLPCPRCQGTGLAKCAEIDITNMTSDQVWDAIKIQERQGRTWEYKTIKPYNWPSLDEGEEVER